MRVAREHLGLSQQALADDIGVSKRGIQDNETRNRVPGGEVINGFIRLGINANWLLTGQGPMLLADLAPAPPPVLREQINIDALVQAFVAMKMTAKADETIEATARKAVNFYLYCVENGLITPTGAGEGNLRQAS